MKPRILIIMLLLGNVLSAQTNLVSYEYWFNNDYANVQAETITPTQQHVLNTNFDVSTLPDNVNVLNVRYRDGDGKYSGISSKFFIKMSAVAIESPDLVAYEYWFNNDYANVQAGTITPTQQHVLNTNFDVSTLPDNVNVLNVRYRDGDGKYSGISSKFFIKMSAVAIESPDLVAYEYWFNNDYANVQAGTITPTQQHVLNTNFDVSTLPDNVNVLNVRYRDGNGKYSGISSKFFVKMPAAAIESPDLVAYEYWFNNDYANVQAETITPTQQHVLNTNFDVSTLPDNVNVLNVRYRDENGKYSGIVSKFFIKIPYSTPANNKIISYQYWIDNDFAGKQVVNLSTPVQQINILNDLDLSRITKGNHTIYVQFLDSLGAWSIVNSHDFEKTSFPIADFDYVSTLACDSTTIAFTDNSIDGDTYFWDFGDGNTSTDVSPEHVFYTSGTYLISQTVTDSSSSKDSTATKTLIVTVNQSSAANIAETVCGSYTAPDGAVYTTSGIKTAVITNAAGCDSTITINLTVNQSSAANIAEVACDSYTAPDGAVYTTSGIKTAMITNAAGCDSTITINLTVNQSSAANIAEVACDSYTAPDGAVYTTSGIKTAVITNAAGCDSTITINLTINTVDTSVVRNGIILTANATADFYQWLDCDNGYSNINGATSQSFTAQKNGSYAVQVTQNGCMDTSACHAVTTIGIIENTFCNDITVYPNPTDGILKIDLGETFSDFIVSIVDINGKLIEQSNYKNTQKFELNLDVPSGIYLLVINSGNDKATIRLIKN